jgi:hypothetical protein
MDQSDSICGKHVEGLYNSVSEGINERYKKKKNMWGYPLNVPIKMSGLYFPERMSAKSLKLNMVGGIPDMTAGSTLVALTNVKRQLCGETL